MTSARREGTRQKGSGCDKDVALFFENKGTWLLPITETSHIPLFWPSSHQANELAIKVDRPGQRVGPGPEVDDRDRRIGRRVTERDCVRSIPQPGREPAAERSGQGGIGDSVRPGPADVSDRRPVEQ